MLVILSMLKYIESAEPQNSVTLSLPTTPRFSDSSRTLTWIFEKYKLAGLCRNNV